MKIAKLIAAALGTGYAPIAPGTVGSMLGVVIFYMFNYILIDAHMGQPNILFLNILFTLVVLLIGVWSIKKVHEIWEHDSGKIVIDEVVGVFITLLAVPFDWRYYLLGLVLFRVFDIWKPLGIRKLDKMQSDWSVMMDDVLAGVYSLISIQLIIYFFPF